MVVETAQGIEFAKCSEGNHDVPEDAVVQPLRSVVRIATENDHRAAAYNRRREKEDTIQIYKIKTSGIVQAVDGT